MKKRKKKGTYLDAYVKAARKGSREAEIELYGKPINHRKVFKSKKVYDRKKYKAGDKGLPYSLLAIANPESPFHTPRYPSLRIP